MKTKITSALVGMTAFFLLISAIGLWSQATDKATESLLMSDMPLNPKVRTGTLSNGLKYYIMKNSKPEKRMSIRLAVNAGAVDEDDDQKGLAHFLEHMCFNGTTDFPKNELVNFLEKTGVQFGAHLNAYTSFDETVYMLEIPTDSDELINKGFQVLENWAHKVTFANEEIDKERGVVIEEMRSRSDANYRLFLKHAPKTWYGSKYPERFPIGDSLILRNAPYSAFKRFYQDWYRPDLMAVVAVGDFDVDKIEKLITSMFSPLKNPEKPRTPINSELASYEGKMISIAKDAEQPVAYTQLVWRFNTQHRTKVNDYKRLLMDQLLAAMLNERYNEYLQKADPPFQGAFAGVEEDLGGKSAFGVTIVNKADNIMSGFNTGLSEIWRAVQNGFTESELDRAKQNLLNGYEQAYKEREKTPSSGHARELVAHFLKQEPAPGIENEYDYAGKIVPVITLREMNKTMSNYISKNNILIQVSMPDNPGVPSISEADIEKAWEEAKNKSYDAYVDKSLDKPLFDKTVKAGTIKDEKKYKQYNVTEWTLSNGARVIFKPTDFKADQVLFKAYSWGGTSLVPDSDYLSAAIAASVVDEAGIAEFDPTNLRKALAGKTLSISPYISELMEGFNGGSSPKDLETMLQLLHLYFTDARKDDATFASFINRSKEGERNDDNDPMTAYRDTLTQVMGSYNYRRMPWNEASYDKVSQDRAISIYKSRFTNAGDFTFVFVGNIDEAEFKKLALQYIGSLPGDPSKAEKYKDLGIRPPKGTLKKEVFRGVDKKSQVTMRIDGDFVYDPQNRFVMSSLVDVLEIRLREQLREEKGGVYGVNVWAPTSKYPREAYSLNISFSCDPKRVKELTDDVRKVIEEVRNSAPSDDIMVKVKETARRSWEQSQKENNAWMNWIYSAAYNNENVDELGEYPKRIEALDPEDIKAAAQKYLNMNELKEFILYPQPDTKQ